MSPPFMDNEGRVQAVAMDVEKAMMTLPPFQDREGQVQAARTNRGKLEWLGVPLAMVLSQVFTTITMLLTKQALNSGSYPFVIIAYRTLVGAVVVAPFAVWLERDMIKEINIKVLGLIFLSAALGAPLAQGLSYYGMRDTDAAYPANFLNLTPIVTFIIAILLRTEKLAFKKWPSIPKLLSTVVCVGGAMVVSMVKGKLLQPWHTHLLKTQTNGANVHHNVIVGTVFLCISCLSYAVWYIIQAKLAKDFPSKYLSTSLACLMGSLQSISIGLIITTDRSAWMIKWDVQLLAAIFSGLFSLGATYVMNIWVIARRGPIYPTMFNSVSLILTTILNSILFGTNIYLGSVLGTLLIIVGDKQRSWPRPRQQARATSSWKALLLPAISR